MNVLRLSLRHAKLSSGLAGGRPHVEKPLICAIQARFSSLSDTSNAPTTLYTTHERTINMVRKHWTDEDISIVDSISISDPLLTWSPSELESLVEAVRELGSDNQWKAVAERVGHDRSEADCEARWQYSQKNFVLYPSRHDAWTDEEVAQLHKLVDSHTLPASTLDAESITNWVSVAKQLGRKPLKCQEKWRESVEKGENDKSS